AALLTKVLPSRNTAVVREALDTTELTATVNTTLSALVVPLGSLGINVSGSLSGFLTLTGAPSPALDLTGTVVGISLDALLGFLGGAVEDLVFPLVGGAVEAVLDVDQIAADVGSLATGTVPQMQPLLSLEN